MAFELLSHAVGLGGLAALTWAIRVGWDAHFDGRLTALVCAGLDTVATRDARATARALAARHCTLESADRALTS